MYNIAKLLDFSILIELLFVFINLKLYTPSGDQRYFCSSVLDRDPYGHIVPIGFLISINWLLT